MVPVNSIMLKKYKSFGTLGKGQFKVKIKIKGENHSRYTLLPISKFNCNRSMIYAEEYELVPVNDIMLKKSKYL